jgi:Protein of unknown function (DUF2939)
VGLAWNKKYSPAIVAALIIVMGASWYFGSPRWTLHQMKEAAAHGDAETFGSYIDFVNLRTSLKDQMRAKLVKDMAAEKNSGFAALGSMMALGMVDTMIDGFVNPSSLQVMFANQQTVENKDEPQSGLMSLKADDMVIERHGLSDFRLVNTKDPSAGKIIFKRDGLSWKMSAIDIPLN